jgi:hypothetical protein
LPAEPQSADRLVHGVGFEEDPLEGGGTAMGDEREPDRDTRSDEEQALDEIRQLFARYRRIARHGVVAEREETAEDAETALAER